MLRNIYFLLGLVTAAVLPTDLMAKKTGAQTPPFLCVMVTEEGSITQNTDGDYVLSIHQDKIDHVMEISKAPFALANFISSDDIVRTWKKNAGNFGTGITMEGTILSEDHTLTRIRIKSIAKDAHGISYVFFMEDNRKLDLDNYDDLDEVTIVNYCCHPDGGSGEWLWGK